MLENLRLDPTDATTRANMLANNDTNASNEAIANYFDPSGTAPQTGWSTVAVADVDTDFNIYTDPRINNAYVDTLVTSYGPAADADGKAKTGIYYNYCAATVGTYCYPENQSLGNANQDVGPANWRMPTGGGGGEYATLYSHYNTTQTATDPASLQYNLSTPLSGYYYGSSAGDRGHRGNFWSSTRLNGSSMYSLYVNGSIVLPSSHLDRLYGLSMRCVVGS